MPFLDELNELPRPRSLVEAASFSSEAAAAKTRLRLLLDFQCEQKMGRPYERLGLGLDILMVAADAARRNATEDAIYPAVIEGLGPLSDMLFDAHGQPKPNVKRLFADCCRHYELRHEFGKKDVHEWFRAIKLQFGFTRHGFENHLHEWLMGHGGHGMPAVPELLLEDVSLRSRSFRKLWEGLLAFRRSNISEAQIRRIVADSPWTLPEWSDDLVVAAKKVLPGHGLPVGEKETRETPQTFLSEPHLRLAERLDEAHWEMELEGLDSLQLNDRSYKVSITGGETALPLVFLYLQSDGTYSNINEVFKIPARSSPDGRVVAELSDSQNRLIASQEVQLFDPDDDVIAYQQERNTDLWRTDFEFLRRGPMPGRPFTLLLRDDLHLDPPPVERAVFGNTGYYLVRARPEDDQSVRILFTDEEELWVSGARHVPHADPLPAGVHPGLSLLQADGVNFFDQPLTLQVTGLEGLRLRRARWRAHPLTVNAEGPVPEIIGIPPHEALTAGVVSVRLTLQGSERTYRTTLQWEPAVGGVLERLEGDSTFEARLEQRSCQQLKVGRYWIFAAEKGGLQVWNLYEGERAVGKVRLRCPHSFHNLGGYGASVTLRQEQSGAPRVFVKRLVDAGIFSTNTGHLQPDGVGGIGCKILPAISEEHQIWFGSLNGPAVSRNAAGVLRLSAADGTVEIAPLRADPCDYIVLAYEGVRLGAWWRDALDGDSWSSSLLQITDCVEAREAAFTLRWAKLPMLSSEHIGNVRTFFREFPGIVLSAWLGPLKHNDARKIEGEITDAWHDAVRSITLGYEEVSAEMLRCLGGDPSADPRARLLDSLEGIGRCNPILMGRLMRHWLETEESDRKTKVQICCVLLAGISADAAREEVQNDEFLRQQLDSAEAAVEVPGYLDDRPAVAQKIATALSNLSFRTLLYHDLITKYLPDK